ncbi:RNA polymerase sigma factor [Patulibacter minatonensis]|uniref:RNA polymerase sigma factor n=1 Tax=Patulibacter minatonensis TaxID=298163 RepID=UPI0004ACA614|nr:RNA polymerase sigma factor [Patulibacter minatonensis]
MARPVDDDELRRRAAQGDDDAFAAFYRRHLPVVIGFHLRRTGRPEFAFDLAAETFAAVIVALPTFRPGDGSAVAWLFGIAHNKLRHSLRRGRVEAEARQRLRHEPIVLEDDALARIEDLGTQTTEHDLRAALADLPDDQRDLLLARVVDERPYAELARELACSEAVVRQRVHRGLRLLRSRLEGRA